MEALWQLLLMVKVVTKGHFLWAPQHLTLYTVSVVSPFLTLSSESLHACDMRKNTHAPCVLGVKKEMRGEEMRSGVMHLSH